MIPRRGFFVIAVFLISAAPQFLLAQLGPLSHWTYGDSTFTYVSGLMDLTDPLVFPTVFLTNHEITYSDIPLDPHGMGGAWIQIRFPDLTIREYALGEFWGIMSCWIICPYYGNCAGYLGTAALTSVDTVGQRVQGWIDFHTNVLGYPVSAKGSFDVPFFVPTTVSLPTTPPVASPDVFELHQNYPNPFNATTEIRFRIRQRAFVSLEICDVRGVVIKTLVHEERSPGSHTVTWDATGVTSGAYICRLRAGDVVVAKKMLLIQ